MMECLGTYMQYLLVFFGIARLVAATPMWYTASDGSNYLIEREPKFNWLQAYDKCANSDLQLVVIDNGPKNTAFVALLHSISAISRSLWLGHQDQFNTKIDKNRPFYSIATGEQIYFNNWSPGEPNNGGGAEHCVSVYQSNTYGWNDDRCDSVYLGYVCEESYHTNSYRKDMDQKRQAIKQINTQLSDDFENTQASLKNITETNRLEVDQFVKTWQESVYDIVGNTTKTIEEKQKEIRKVSDSMQGLIENSFAQTDSSSNLVTSEFAAKLTEDRNDLNSIMAY